MKRLFTIVLLIAVTVALAIPVQSFAASMDQGLENAIKKAKTVFTIPSDYKFTSNMGTDGTKQVYYLNWASKDASYQTNINVRIDGNGIILGYDRYSPSDYSQTTRLPKVSRADAMKKAEGYIRNIDSGLPSQISYVENVQNSMMDSSYYFTYRRVVNGVPFYNDTVTVNVNRQTGALQGFNRQWSDGLVFPKIANPIAIGQAEKSYTDKMGLQLIYRYLYTDGKIKPYAVYTPVYSNNSYAIDAVTGERIEVNGGYFGPYYDMAVAEQKSMLNSAARGGVQLNPDEQKAVEDAAKLKTQADAEKIARSAEFLGLTNDFKLTSYYLSSNYPVRDDYIWSLSFNKEDKEDSTKNQSITVGISANTGTVTSFYRSGTYENSKPKFGLDDARAAADELLNKYYPDIMKQIKYNSIYTESYINNSSTDKLQNYSLKYDRMVNGISFPDNGVNIDYDAIHGTINGFSLTWYETAFPAVDKVLKPADAYGKLFDSVGLELEYKTKNPEQTDTMGQAKILPRQPDGKQDVKLVYVLKPNKPLYLDANTGALLNSSGDPFVEVKPVSYSDITGNSAEKQIRVLAENGIYLDGTTFKPGSAINQKDFMTLLAKTLNYYGPVINAKSAQKDIDDMYAFLASQNIVRKGEKAPDSAVTREDAVKFIIRAMKYDKVADLKGIYICPFKDKSKIDPGLVGYAALAAGLKIVNGSGVFDPKVKTTRADAAVLIYNYLNV